MADWLKLEFKKEDVLFESEKGVLFKLPESINFKKYVGYCFWHRPKMVKKEKGKIIISFPDSWNFKAFKKGENREIIDEVELSAGEMREIVTGEAYPLLEDPKEEQKEEIE